MWTAIFAHTCHPLLIAHDSFLNICNGRWQGHRWSTRLTPSYSLFIHEWWFMISIITSFRWQGHRHHEASPNRPLRILAAWHSRCQACKQPALLTHVIHYSLLMTHFLTFAILTSWSILSTAHVNSHLCTCIPLLIAHSIIYHCRWQGHRHHEAPPNRPLQVLVTRHPYWSV